jgi:hypothetical protein
MTATIISERLGDDIAAGRALADVETDPADQLLVDDLPGPSEALLLCGHSPLATVSGWPCVVMVVAAITRTVSTVRADGTTTSVLDTLRRRPSALGILNVCLLH